MTNTDFERIDYVNNWNVCYSKKYNQWMIEHDDGYYIMCDNKNDAYSSARTITRPNLEAYQEV